MQKKRKVWWIVGAVGFVVLLAIAVLWLQANSPDAKMEATLEAIVVRYDLEHTITITVDNRGTWGSIDTYSAQGLTASEIEEILKTLVDACQSCGRTREYGGFDFNLGDGYDAIAGLSVSTFGDVAGRTDRGYYCGIQVIRRPQLLWDRVNNVWPWGAIVLLLLLGRRFQDPSRGFVPRPSRLTGWREPVVAVKSQHDSRTVSA